MRTVDSAAGPIHVVQTREDAARLWRWLQQRSGQALGLDAETNAVNPFAAGFVLRAVQVADSREGWVIQAQRPDILALDVVRTVVSSHPYWVGHYAGEYDLRFIERAHPGSVRLGQIAPHIADTQVCLAHHDPRTVTSNDTFSANGAKLALPAGLKDAAPRVLGYDCFGGAEDELYALFAALAPKGHRAKQASRTWGFANIDQDDEIYLRYAGLDAIVAVQFFEHMKAALIKRGVWPEVCRDLRRQWHIDQMTFRGLLVDEQYTRWIGKELEAAVDAQRPVLAFHGVAPSGMGGSIATAMNVLNVTSTRTSKETGAPSWDKKALKPLSSSNDAVVAELVGSIQLVRKASKMGSTYVKPALAAVEHGDGRVHCRMRGFGAIHGRQTASDPPLHQQPKRVDTRIRPMYVAGAGNVWVTADFRQGEPRVMAARSGDKQLKYDILHGDLNSAIAAETYGNTFNASQADDETTIHYQMRQSAKAGFLARCYAAGADTLSETLSISLTAAKAALDRWDKRYPDLARHTKRLNQLPYITFDCGRIAPLWDRYFVGDDGVPRCGNKPSRLGLNYDTCGHQRDLFCSAIDRVIDWGWSWSLAFLLHDEILCCVPIERAEECRQMLEAAMSMNYLGMPFEAKAKIEGQSWMPRPQAFDASIIEEIEL